MAKKVTISIPDLLHEKLEKWRESFNLSKMFQDAVVEAIQRKEEFQKRIREDLDLGQIIERLRREKMQSEQNSLASGKDDGIAWAKNAHYDDLQYALHWQDFSNAAKDTVLGHYFTNNPTFSRLSQNNTYSIAQYGLSYLSGWKQGIEQFWEEVREKL
jgi:hypothetical protein